MLKGEDLERARAVFFKTREIWFADSLVDAHERLALVTVAARLREFAFLSHLKPGARVKTAAILAELGFESRVLNARFDLNVKVKNVSGESARVYRTDRARRRFFGLGVWLVGSEKLHRCCLTLSGLGTALGYPKCCVRMDVTTKEEDHQLSLQALASEFGDDPRQISWALRRGCPIEKSSYAYLRRWERRYKLTLTRYPFALHAACDKCLKQLDSPSALLNRSFQTLAQEVSDELHFLVRWAAHIVSGGRDQ